MSELLSGYLDRAALAKELNVCQRTIARYESQPNGLPVTVIGGRRLYKMTSVMAWLEARERRPNPTRARRAA
ncbi:MAG: hypothetical protein KDH20_12720 [Rhodocyclaceae bacterium]|jgi:hypothetical protein|nr:hypothetical protein [Rhodocyclaceae bacterium]MCB9966419.1 hypothetical protein [Geminicoccaceae bacterium]HRY26693.1 hypothetical protein [Geminicoccaceae bacterium]